MIESLVMVAWLSAIVRLWATFRFPSRPRWYLTAAVALFVSSLSLQLNARHIDLLLHVPNISILAAHLVLISVGVSVLLIFDSFLGRQPDVARRVKPAVVVASIYTAGWAASPIHHEHLSNVAVLQSSSMMLAVVVSDCYLIYWAGVLAKRSWQHAILGDTALPRVSLLVISTGAIERVLASITNIIRVTVTVLPDRTEELLSEWGFALAYLASFSVAVGAALSVIAHSFQLVNTHRRLGSLWRELTRMAPQVVLPPPQTRIPGSAVVFRATRRRIEIVESLFRLSLDADRADAISGSTRPEAELGSAVADGLVSLQQPADGRVLAGKVLPPARTRREETAQLLRIADGYRRGLPPSRHRSVRRPQGSATSRSPRCETAGRP
jgi:hypothetical protein